MYALALTLHYRTFNFTSGLTRVGRRLCVVLAVIHVTSLVIRDNGIVSTCVFYVLTCGERVNKGLANVYTLFVALLAHKKEVNFTESDRGFL